MEILQWIPVICVFQQNHKFQFEVLRHHRLPFHTASHDIGASVIFFEQYLYWWYIDHLTSCHVIMSLQKDINTRQASITIHDPIKDDFGKDGKLKETKDTPCTRTIQFMVVDGKLDCTVTMRSNDVLWGFSAAIQSNLFILIPTTFRVSSTATCRVTTRVTLI